MAHFDQAIPPGGEGRVTLTVDLKDYQGEFRKTAVVYSNDPRRPALTLSLQGRVRPWIEVRPAAVIFFQGGKDQDQEKVLEILSETRPLGIRKIETDIGDRITYALVTVTPGKHYRLTLKVSNRAKGFSGEVRCLTDHPEKPELRIRVEFVP